ncbi:hypothetical protein HK099_000289 [Clydaea vesicula]|uniref:Uncharacterized protein n=1 Tax=Clydaea vesicula TaxID=447962 RepID=A0AAD5Y036_9FUNG|nr:hypothetical protein HK099_000289 [Clydaea vesicula]
MFECIAKDKRFSDLVRQIFNNYALSDGQILEELSAPLYTAIQKVHVSKVAHPGNPKKRTFFTQEMSPTEESIKLYEKVYDSLDADALKYDQRSTTCISDVKVMIYRYGKYDEFINELCPNHGYDSVSQSSVTEIAKHSCLVYLRTYDILLYYDRHDIINKLSKTIHEDCNNILLYSYGKYLEYMDDHYICHMHRYSDHPYIRDICHMIEYHMFEDILGKNLDTFRKNIIFSTENEEDYYYYDHEDWIGEKDEMRSAYFG